VINISERQNHSASLLLFFISLDLIPYNVNSIILNMSNFNPTIMQDMINDSYTDILIDILATADEELD
jgi:hypothetical protein